MPLPLATEGAADREGATEGAAEGVTEGEADREGEREGASEQNSVWKQNKENRKAIW